jgi:hypothetical protein
MENRPVNILTVEADDPGGERNHLGRVGVSVERKAVGLLA